MSEDKTERDIETSSVEVGLKTKGNFFPSKQNR